MIDMLFVLLSAAIFPSRNWHFLPKCRLIYILISEYYDLSQVKPRTKICALHSGIFRPHRVKTLSNQQPLFVCSEIYREAGYKPPHPLAIERIGPLMDICRELGWLNESNWRESPRASFEDLIAFHDADYVEAVWTVSQKGTVSTEWREKYRLGTMENPVFKHLWERASTSVGGSIHAARLAMDGRIVYHPAGGTHHGRKDRASGFCYFNDPVFAMLEFLKSGLQRVAYLDLDAHHGDGVEAAFLDDARTLCISAHEEKRWPGTGQEHLAHALNYPVRRGFANEDLARLMRDDILPALLKFGPQAIVITCGSDALAGDPLSSMQLSNTSLWEAVKSATLTAPRAVVLGGGGYNPWTTVRCWSGLWGALNDYPMPQVLPESVKSILARFECDLVDEDERKPEWFDRLNDPIEMEIRQGRVRHAIAG